MDNRKARLAAPDSLRLDSTPEAPPAAPERPPVGDGRPAARRPSPLNRFRVLAGAALIAVLGVIWGGFAYLLHHEHAEAIERVETDTANLALAFEKYVESSLSGIDLALVVLRDLWLRQPEAVGVVAQPLLTSRQARGLALQYLLVDADGKVVYSTGPRNEIASVVEQEFFRTHRRSAEPAAAGGLAELPDRLYLGAPVRGASGQWLMFCSRPIYDAARRFVGVVAVVVDPTHLSRSTELLDLGPRGVATLALRDGAVLAHSVGRRGSPSDVATPIDWPDAHQTQRLARAGTLRLRSPLDAEPRILSFRQHPEYPVWVGVGKSEYDVLAPFYQLSVFYGAVAALASMVLCGLVLLLVRARARLAADKAQVIEEAGRYRGLFDNLPEGIVIFDLARGEVQAFNDAAQSLLGRSAEGMRLLGPADLQLDNPPSAGRHGVHLVRADGRAIDVEISVARCDHGGRAVAQCVLRDATQQRQAETELRASRSLYQGMVAALPEGVLMHLENGTIAACNPAAERILGLTAAELVGRHSVDLRWPAIREDGSIFPGARQPAIVALGSGLPQRDVLMGLRKPGSEVTWISMNAEPLRHQPGDSPYAVVVSLSDVTARQAGERAQREAAKVFATVPGAIVVTDLDGGIRCVNPAFSQLTGYTREEAVGRRMALLRSGAHDQSFYRGMWQSLRERGEWQGEVCDRRKDGKLFSAYLAISAVRDAQGYPLEFVGMFSDLAVRRARLEESVRAVG